LAALRRSFTGAPGRSWVVEQINDAVGRLARTLSPYPDPDNWDEETLRSERYFYDGIRRIQEVVVDGLPTLAFAQGDPGLGAMAASCLGACQHDVDGDALPAALEARLLDNEEPEPPEIPEFVVRLSREYVWGPGDRGVDELLAQFDEFDQAWFVLQDEGGDAIALCDLGGSGGAARVVAQYTYDPYGQVITHEHLHAHAWLHAGHKGLFVDRLDLGVANSAGDDQPRLVSGANILAYNRNRTLKPDLGRYLQQDPNATGLVLIESELLHGSPASPGQVGLLDLMESFRDGANHYAYLRSNTFVNTDPLGLFLGLDLTGLATSILRSMVEAYASNQDWDVDWAMEWSARDDEHSRLDNRWITLAMLMGAAEHFFGDDWLDDDSGPGSNWLMASGGRGGGFGRGTQRRPKYVRPPGVGIPDLPPATEGGKTAGVLRTPKFEVKLVSGEGAHAQLRGAGNRLRTHVESKAISIMQRHKVTSARLYLNRAPCTGRDGGCDALIRKKLLPGQRLHVYVNGKPHRSYTGGRWGQ
jgi:hypothetical protein